jgi:bifunctional UDP-N-acetylglucosamine pyrophosphorylase / glucosamine-1-phosphate N-acetyltransferase
MNPKIQVVVLAGGLGRRMNSDLPKALIPFRGKPIVSHVLDAVKDSGVCDRPTVVVGVGREQVMRELGDGYQYVVQEKQLGTGHAVLSTEHALLGKAENIMVLYADMPFISSGTIRKLAQKHLNEKTKMTMAIAQLPDFDDWRAIFYKSFSRIIRDKDGEIIKDVQFKDATEEERETTEVSPCYFCFDSTWLWSKLRTLQTDNFQHEYYLTDLVEIAIKEKTKIGYILVDAVEALAANSKEDLAILDSVEV